MGEKRVAKHRVHFTKKALARLECPESEKCIYVYDRQQCGLAVRVLKSGRKVFIWYGKVEGRATRKNIGRFPEWTIEQARQEASDLCREADGGTLRKSFKSAEALDLTLSASDRGERARFDWHYAVDRFMDWLKKTHPGITRWEKLTRDVLDEYLATMKNLSATSRRLRMQPICQTSGYMHLKHGYTHIAERMGIGSKLSKPPAQVYLVDVVNFLDWLSEIEPRLEVGAALQSLAGLQLQEATRLTWDKVNLDGGLIEISGQVKNEYRNRVIPVATRCLDALKRVDAARRAAMVQDNQGVVLTNKSGFEYGKNWLSYSKEMSAAIKAWNPNITWKPKDLRNCLPTFSVSQGIYGPIWEQYIGHAPKTVTERHYIPRLGSVSLGEDEALEKQMNYFRRFVVEPIDDTVSDLVRKKAK